jgi:hypothetical protein
MFLLNRAVVKFTVFCVRIRFWMDHPVYLPAPSPIVKYNVMTFWAKTLSTKHTKARTAPAMVTARQPYLFTKELEMGPTQVKHEDRDCSSYTIIHVPCTTMKRKRKLYRLGFGVTNYGRYLPMLPRYLMSPFLLWKWRQFFKNGANCLHISW